MSLAGSVIIEPETVMSMGVVPFGTCGIAIMLSFNNQAVQKRNYWTNWVLSSEASFYRKLYARTVSFSEEENDFLARCLYTQ